MMNRWSPSLSTALIAAVLAAWPAGPVQAMLLPEDIANLRAPIQISLSLPSGGPFTPAP